MEKSLTEAAKKGDVKKLHDLIKHDPFLLGAANLAEGDNPLHIACLGGHVDFVKQILDLSPDFAQELNPNGFSPLHIASATGNIEIVKELLNFRGLLCLVKGKEKRIPLHSAVSKGRTKVVRLLMLACLESVKEVTARGESCFHLAVKNNQFETFKVLCDSMFYDSSSENVCILNMKDEQGNTILHLAASRKIYEVIDLLLDEKFVHKDKLEVNPLNKYGLTPLDVLISEGGGDPSIEEMLRLSGAFRNQENHAPQHNLPADNNQSGQEQMRRSRRPKSALRELQEYFKYDMTKDSPGKARNTLLVIAVLIVTATYQAVLSPPGGVWQDYPPNADNTTTTAGGFLSAQRPGQSVMGARAPVSFGVFLLFNSFGFFMSLQMMYILTCGFPMQLELRLSLVALTVTYDTCMAAITPGGVINTLFVVCSIAMPAVVGLLSMLRNCKKGRRRRRNELQSTNESV